MTGIDADASALRAVRDRYASWTRLDPDQAPRERDEPVIRAIQLLLRLERDAHPSWHRALAAAASGCAALCLDPRSRLGGEWHSAVTDYCGGHIRKVTRRGRGAQWEATTVLPGLSVDAGAGTEIRVLVPGPVAELDKRVAKLQVGGTDLPVDEPPLAATSARGGVADLDGSLEVLVPVHQPMTAGKLMAQTGHAGMLAAALLGDRPDTLDAWSAAGCPTRVRRCGRDEWAALLGQLGSPPQAWRDRGLLAVRDAGFTEVAPGTVTVLAHWPDPR